VPHERETSNDLDIARRLSLITSRKVVHSGANIAQMEDYGIDVSNVVTIPQGSYVGQYPDTCTRDEARKKLRVEDRRVLLSFGTVRPYKGLDDLLTAYADVEAHSTRLIIAGQCDNSDTQRRIDAFADQHEVDFFPGYVAEEEVAKYFRAADVVCCPFRQITNSSSVLLAFSFGKPVVAPRLGSLADLPKDVGFFYDPLNPNSLLYALRAALSTSREELDAMGTRAARVADGLSWEQVAEETFRLYMVVASIKPHRGTAGQPLLERRQSRFGRR
jgi:beta-1,4-mannosyltransferase